MGKYTINKLDFKEKLENLNLTKQPFCDSMTGH